MRGAALALLFAANGCSPEPPLDLSQAPSAPTPAPVDAGAAEPTLPPRPTDVGSPSRSSCDALSVSGSSLDAFGLEIELERRAEVDALALFAEDRFDCKGRETLGTCEIHGRASLTAGALSLSTLLVRSSWEHDGMYWSEESIAIVALSPQPKVGHTLMQWDSDVEDCGSSLRIRRWAAAKATDGRDLVCIESIEEEGVGLFDVMHDDDAGRPWMPLRRARSIEALTWSAGERALVRSPDDRPACPKKGYALFVPVDKSSAPLEARRGVQGDAPTVPCPKTMVGPCILPMCKGITSRTSSQGSSSTPPLRG